MRLLAFIRIVAALAAVSCGVRQARAQAPVSNATQIEQGVLSEINRIRAIFQVPPLQPDATLSQVAREHSIDMMSRGMATHDSAIAGRRTPEDRYRQAFGVAPEKVTENVAVQPASLAAPGFVYVSLTSQPDTFKNSVDRDATTIGVGVAVGPDGRVWATVMFARPAGARRPPPAVVPNLPLPPPSERPAPPPPQTAPPPAPSGGSDAYRGTLSPQFLAFFDAIGGFGETYRLTQSLPQGDAAVKEFLAFIKAAFYGEHDSPTISARPLRYGVLGTQLKLFEFVRPRFNTDPGNKVNRTNPRDIPRNIPINTLTFYPAKRTAASWGYNLSQNLIFDVPLPGGPRTGEVRVFLDFGLGCAGGTQGPDGRIGGVCTLETKNRCRVDIESGNNNTSWNTIIVRNLDSHPMNDIKLAWYAVPSDASGAEYSVYLDRTPETKFISERLTADARGLFPVLVAVVRRGGAPAVTEARPPARPDPAPPPAKPEPRLPAPAETSAQLDEDRAADIRWLHSIEQALRRAERKKMEARETLFGLARCIQEWQERIDKLSSWLRDLPPGEESSQWLTISAEASVDAWDSAWGTPPGPGQNMRVFIAGQIEQLKRQVKDARQEQDLLIQETLDTYEQGIVHELRARGPQSNWDQVRTGAQRLVTEVNQMTTLAKAELYLAADRGNEFRQAARACILEGRFVPEARFLEAVYFQQHNDFRQALEGFRRVAELTASPQEMLLTGPKARELATGGNSLHDRAAAMVWILEDGYLKSIAGKASAEALQARADVDERLQKGGEAGWLGFMMANLKLGVVSRVSALTGREDALEGLASAYQDNVAAQEYGLSIMRSLHERGVAPDSLDGMNNQQFLSLIRSQYKEAGAKVTSEDAVRMRAAIKAAMGNPDVKRLVSGSKQMLAVDTGADYFGHQIYAGTALEWYGDIVNLANVAMLLMPSNLFGVTTKVAGAAELGLVTGARATGTAIAAAGASKLPTLLAATKTGQVMLQQFSRFFAKSTWLEDRALDVALQMVAGKAGEGIGGTIGILTGSDGKVEAEAGAMFGNLLASWSGGDLALMKKMAAESGIAATHLRGLVETAARGAKETADFAALASRHSVAIRRKLPSLPGEVLAPEARRLAGMTKQELAEELRQATKELYENGTSAVGANGEPLLNSSWFRRMDAIKAAYMSAAAIEGGAQAQARAWLDLLDQQVKELGGEVVENQNIAAQAVDPDVTLVNLVKPSATAPRAAPNIELATFRGITYMDDLDRMVFEGKFAGALPRYEERLAVLEQLGRVSVAKAAQLPEKIAYLKRMAELDGAMGQWPKAGTALAHTRPATTAEVMRLEAASHAPDPSVKLESISHSPYASPYEVEMRSLAAPAPVAGNVQRTETLTQPSWVMEKRGGTWEPVGLFKRSIKQGGYDLRAEVVYSDIARELGLDVPACAMGKMTIDGALTDGVFIRFAPGARASVMGPLVAPLIKAQVAADKVLSAAMGDLDRHMGNYLVAGRGSVTAIDHGLADFTGEGVAGYPATEFAGGVAASKEMMRLRIIARRNNGLRSWDQHITFEDMLPMLKKVEALAVDKPSLRKILAKTLSGDELERAMTVFANRASVLREVMRECYGTLRELKPIPLARVLPFGAAGLARAA